MILTCHGIIGEVNITRGAGKCSVIQMVSTNASCSLEEMSSARISPKQVQFFQFYKNKDNKAAEELLRRAEGLGYKAIFLTVDAIVAGNRERDIKSPWIEDERERELKELELGKVKRGDGGAGLADVPERKGDEDDGGYEDEKEEVGGLAGALLRTADMDMSWVKVKSLPPLAPFQLTTDIYNSDHPVDQEDE